ncbi:MAG: TolC family protein [Bryobacteraceae bacterium]
MFTQKFVILFFVVAGAATSEVRSLTLKQALDLASRQNPDVALARLDQQRAEEGIKVAHDPFVPKLTGGSGLAYTYGYPNSINGNAPSLFEARTDMDIYNRPKSYQLAAAKETARGSQLGAQAKADDVAYQAADLFLSASEAAHERQTVSEQVPSLRQVVQAMTAGVNEGSELPLDLKRARVNLAVSQQRLESTVLDQDYYEMMLAVVLGYPASDRVKPIDTDASLPGAPHTEEEATDIALRNNRDLRQMQSNVLAKQLDLRSYKAARLPQISLVAQYALFARYNYINYFAKFQRNNFQIGAAVTIPLLIGSASQGLAEQALTDMQKIRIQMDQVRNRIITDTRRSYQQWKKAESFRDLVRMQLDLAREQMTVYLAQNAEGRVPMPTVEQARLEESDRWIDFYVAETQVKRTQLAILRDMGTLLAAIRTSAVERQP